MFTVITYQLKNSNDVTNKIYCWFDIYRLQLKLENKVSCFIVQSQHNSLSSAQKALDCLNAQVSEEQFRKNIGNIA